MIRDCALDVFTQRGGASPGLVTTYDKSRWGHDLTLHNNTWVQEYDGSLWLPQFNGTTAYMDRAHADTEALGITGGLLEGYTIMGWINWTDTTNSEIIIGRYEVDVGGWELYLYHDGLGVYSLNQRHHHAGTVIDGHPRTASYSNDWIEGMTWHFAVVFNGNGTDATHYRNGVAVAVVSSTGGMLDFESTTQDLVVGVRYSLGANWYWGWMGLVRFYPYIMSPAQVRARYHAEKSLFGVPV